MDQVDAKTLRRWQAHLQDEADAAYLYEAMAAYEFDEKRRVIFAQLAEVERGHAELWCDVLERYGVTATVPAGPSSLTRCQMALARVFGSQLILRALIRTEREEVLEYLQLYRTTNQPVAQDAARKLVTESAGHAERLRKLTTQDGEAWHQAASSGDVLRSVVYGFNDGLTANFGLVAGLVGAQVSSEVALISGIAGVIADSLSMASSGYLAAKSEQEVNAHEIEIERAELELMPEIEENELYLMYRLKGFSQDLARQMASEVIGNPELALAEKMREELQISPAHTTPTKEAWVTGTATAIGALIPVLPFFFFELQVAVWVAFAVSMFAHFAVGAARALFTGRSVWRSGWDMFGVGFGVAVVAYFIGEFATKHFGLVGVG